MRLLYVNVYEVDRRYGGPEEGGWWYDVGVVVKKMPVLASKGPRLLARVRSWCQRMNEAERNRFSTIGTPDFEVALTDEPGENFPTERPRYE